MRPVPHHVSGTLLALGLRGILVLDLANRISGLAKGNQHSLGEVDTFFVTFCDLVPRRAVPRTRMINESGFDCVRYDDKAVFWHSVASCFQLGIPRLDVVPPQRHKFAKILATRVGDRTDN